MNHKYYDHENNRPWDLEKNTCSLLEWKQLEVKEKKVIKHPHGFNIFISPDQIENYDEYSASDPYSVKKGINSEFQKRRFELSIDLLKEAISLRQCPFQILDIGCGEGHLTEQMRQSVKQAEFTGLDYSVSAIEYAHKHFPEIDFAVGDAYNCPYQSKFFDVVICNNLWEHVPDPLFLLERIKKVLKPEGYLIISTPSRYRLKNMIRKLKGKPVTFMSEHHVTEYTIGQVKEQLTFGGLNVERVISKPIKSRMFSEAILYKCFSMLLSLTGSRTQLESTIFYLAKKME